MSNLSSMSAHEEAKTLELDRSHTPETLSERIIQAFFAGQDATDLRALADSAPELLDAAKVCLRRLDFLLDNGTGEYSDAYLKLKAAIAKAEGRLSAQ